MSHKQRDYTGSSFEEDCLFPNGRIPANHGKVEVKPFREAMLECMKEPQYKPEELSDPPARWINDVHCLTASSLGLKDFKALKVFPALHRSADQHYHTDFLMSYRDPDTGKEVIVTADLTINKAKSAGGQSADIVIYPDGAEAHPRYAHLGSSRSFRLPEVEYGDKKDEAEWKTNVRKLTANLIADVIRAKLSSGERYEYQSLYSARNRLTAEARTAMNDVLQPKKKAVAATPTPPQ